MKSVFPRHRVTAILVANAAVAALCGLLVAAERPSTDARASPSPETGAKTVAGPPYPANLIVKSELRMKANFVRDNLSAPPQLVFFGGSRCQRFDPVFARERLGLRAMNLAHSCAKPEAAWALVNWLYRRAPDTKLRWVWGVQPSLMTNSNLDPVLLQSARFYRYFPDSLLDSQRRYLPDSVSEMPTFYGFLRNRYSSRGLLLWNIYDTRRANGYTLSESLDDYIAKMLRKGGGTTSTRRYDSRASRYFEKTLALLNEHGTTPVLVLMPVHPRVLRVMREHHMGGARERLKAYLLELQATYDIKVLDFTSISSFNGERAWFYDGVHITRRNANRLISALKAQADECF